jgi:hypothetical protein
LKEEVKNNNGSETDADKNARIAFSGVLRRIALVRTDVPL